MNKIMVNDDVLMSPEEIDNKILSLEKELTFYRGISGQGSVYKPLYFTRKKVIEVLHDSPVIGAFQEIHRSTIIDGPFEASPILKKPEYDLDNKVTYSVIEKFYPLGVILSDFTTLTLEYRNIKIPDWPRFMEPVMTSIEQIINHALPHISSIANQSTKSSRGYTNEIVAVFDKGYIQVEYIQGFRDHPWTWRTGVFSSIIFGTQDCVKELTKLLDYAPVCHSLPYDDDYNTELRCSYKIFTADIDRLDWKTLGNSDKLIK